MNLPRSRATLVGIRFIALILFFGLALIRPGSAASQADQYDDPLKEWFLKEAPGQWLAYVEKTKLLQGQVESRIIFKGGADT